MKMLALLFAIGALAAVHAADVTKGNFGAARSDENKPKTERKSERKTDGKPREVIYPFYGTLDSVDAKEKTITLRGKKKNRVIIVTSDTRIRKSSGSGTLQDGTPGERVSGSLRKNAAGQEEAITIRFGPKE